MSKYEFEDTGDQQRREEEEPTQDLQRPARASRAR